MTTSLTAPRLSTKGFRTPTQVGKHLGIDNVRLLQRSGDETRQDRATSKTSNRKCYLERTLATRQRLAIIYMTNSLPFSGDFTSALLPQGASLSRWR
jgi:hypothetical protein